VENNNNPCNMMLHKNLKSDQNSGEQPTPFYPWMGIVGKFSNMFSSRILNDVCFLQKIKIRLHFLDKQMSILFA
jgi:hypothetical protein